jgi:tetratricopeptide (TPR) repeat protein
VSRPAPNPDATKWAVELAQKAVTGSPDAAHIVNTLGIAYYRAGDWKAAIDTLKRADALYRGNNFSSNAFFIAMAHWQQGEKEQARKWYVPATVWMEKYGPKNAELLCFRSEAASLLQFPEKLAPEHTHVEADGDEYYTLVINAHTEAAWAWSGRGLIHAELGHAQEATADFAKAVEFEKDDPFHRYRQALSCLQLGDVTGYRNICKDMLDKFGLDAKAESARWTVWTCVLAGDAVADWKVPLQLAEKAVADNPKNYQSLNYHGATLYRASQYQDSLKKLTEAEAAYQHDEKKLEVIAYNWLFLAMAYHRLGHVGEANKRLDMAVQWIDEKLQKPKEPSSVRPLPLNRRLTLQLLCREAEELLKQK